MSGFETRPVSRQQRRAHERAVEKAERKRGKASQSVLAIGALLAASSASAANFEVTNLDDDGPGSLRDAIEQANALAGADVITFASGLTGTIPLTTGSLDVYGDLTIDGPGASVITIDGSGNGTYGIFYLYTPPEEPPHDADINNLTLTAGTNCCGGGAVSSFNENLTLDNVVITGSTAPIGGGVYIYAADGTTDVTNSTITGNTADFVGGGLYIAYGYDSVYLRSNTISDNQAGFAGGGLYVGLYDGTLEIRNTVIANNTSGTGLSAPGAGGGIMITGYYQESVLIADCVISGNVADPNDESASPLPGTDDQDRGAGGGIIIGGVDATFQRTTISGNTAFAGGGVFIATYYYPGSVTFENVTIADNTASSPLPASSGGGVYIYANDLTVAINETTIAGNSAATGGGGIDIADVSEFVTVNLYNSIVADNTGGATTPDIDSGPGTVASSYTLIEEPGTATIVMGTGNITGVDPQLGALAVNGSQVFAGAGGTMQQPRTKLPAPTSPVVNTGDPAFVPPPATDERGLPRVAGGRIDMGAAELQPTLVITGPAATAEGNSLTTPFVFTVTLSSPSLETITVNYMTADGTATAADGDYVATSGTLTFVPGDQSETITVNVNGDTKFEPNELFAVLLSVPANATIGTSSAAATINNDDPIPTVSIGNVTLAEGNAGATLFMFPVTLSNPSSQTVTVDFTTANGTATTADNDYAALTGTVTFNPGVTAQTITITVNGDGIPEATENFTVNLSNPANATINTGTGTGTITNDDVPTLSIGNVTLNEGNAGTTPFTFTVTLSTPSTQTVTVNYTTADGPATTADGDYALTSGTLTFVPGDTSETITVNVNGETKFEPNENFAVNLSGPSNATIATGSATGTITNDDVQPTISIGPFATTEGNAGTTAFTFPVTLSNASSQTVTVNFTTVDGTATIANNDYQALAGTVTFNPGVTAQTITINVNGDTNIEGDETFTVSLSAPTNATIATGSATGTITNDEGLPTLSIAGFTAAEGNAGTAPFTFTVTLSAPTALTVTVNYTTADGTATTADGDYALATGTVTFVPGDVSETITVNVNGDTKFESNETFAVNLSGPTNAAIATGSATGTITNDDATPTISIGDVSTNEGNAGTTAFTFPVTLSNASSQIVTVNFATANGTATTVANDYQALSGTVTFNPGVVAQTVTINVNGDLLFETNETFTVNLSAPSNATIASGTGTGTIQNDDVNNADVSITQTAPVSPFVGQNGTFNITVTNAGPNPATNVVVTDVLGAGMTFVSATPSQGTCSGTTTVTCNLGALNSGSTATVALTVTFTAPGPATNTVSVSAAPQLDPNAVNNTAIAIATVVPSISSSEIPTLSETMLMFLAGILAAFGAWFAGKK